MRLHEHARHAGGDRRAREHRHELALAARRVALLPGKLHEWVASNTTGQPVSRMIASERMSETRLW
jgi:hypothetical protein